MENLIEIKKILIINPEGSYFTNPTLSAFGNALIANGYCIKVLVPKNQYFKGDTKFTCYNSIVRKLKSLMIERLYFINLDWIVAIINLIILRERFDLIIGVDRQGIIEANILCKLFKAKKAFFSFEIMFKDETSKSYKHKEIIACEKLSFWLVQDDVRGKLLSQENKLDDSLMIVVPVAESNKFRVRNSSIRDDLKIPKYLRVAALIGSLSEMTLFGEIVSSVRFWPPNWVLLLHDKDGKASEKLKNLNLDMDLYLKSRIFVSDKIIKNFSDIDYLLNGLDVGMALYSATGKSKYLGKNIQFIGASSGKISTYTMCGIPIITNLNDWHSEMLEKYGYGIKINSIDQMQEALITLEESNNIFKSKAIEFYKSNLDFCLYEKKLMVAVKRCLS